MSDTDKAVIEQGAKLNYLALNSFENNDPEKGTSRRWSITKWLFRLLAVMSLIAVFIESYKTIMSIQIQRDMVVLLAKNPELVKDLLPLAESSWGTLFMALSTTFVATIGPWLASTSYDRKLLNDRHIQEE